MKIRQIMALTGATVVCGNGREDHEVQCAFAISAVRIVCMLHRPVTRSTPLQSNVRTSLIKRVVVALYEAKVNVVAHAWRGTVLADIEVDRISLLLQDEGPGIPDIGQAMQEGFSTASAAVREMGFGAGMGLPNMKKNVDELTIESKVGEGTVVRMLTYFSANKQPVGMLWAISRQSSRS